MSSVYSPGGGMQYLPCQRCQALLPPNEPSCRNCGYNNAANQGNNSAAPQVPSAMGGWGGPVSQQPYEQAQGQYGGASWGQPAISPSPTAQPRQPTPGSRPSSSGLLRSSGGNFFGESSAPTPITQDNPGQAMSPASSSSFVSRPLSGALSSNPASQASYSMSPTGPGSFAGQGQYPAGFVAPNTSPPFGGQGQYPAGFAAPNTSPSQPLGNQYVGMPGMAPNAPPFGGQGQYPAGFAAPNTSPSQPLGNQYAGMPGMAPNVPTFAQQTNRDAMPPPAFNETLSSRRKPKPWIIALIVLLVVVIVGGGFAGYTILNGHNNTATKPTSVATVVPQGTPLFADTFKDNANKWNLHSYPNEFAVSIANHSLVLEDDQHELLWELLPGTRTYGDFTLSVDSTLTQGQQNNGYGIYIRGSSIQNSELGTYYRFEIYGDGSYAIFKGALNTGSVKLVDYTLNSAIQKEGSVNHILITAKGSAMSLTVNGQVVKTITDSSYTHGSLAFFVSNLQNAPAGAKANFSNLAIYPA